MKNAKKKHLKALKRKQLKKARANAVALQKMKVRNGEEFNPNNRSLWKKTKTVKTLFGKKEVPFFDYHFLYSMGEKSFQNAVSGDKRMPVTEEMVIWFLKSISNIDPLTLPHTLPIGTKEYSKQTLDLLLYWLQGIADKKFFTERRVWFGKHVHLIKNPKMKLMLYQKLSVKCLDYVDFDDMKKCSKGLTTKEKLILSHWDGRHKELKNDSWEDWKNSMERQTDNGYIYVYRTFKVRKGESIRKGVQKSCTKHKAGSGISYSLSKMSALWVSHWMHKSFMESFGWTIEDMKENFSRLHHFESYSEPLQLQDDVYCALGLFRVKEENIIGLSNTLNEEEVIAHPKDVELIDYRFLNHEDCIASMGMYDVSLSMYDLAKKQKKDIADAWGNSSWANRDSWFDVYRYLVSQKTKEEKQKLMDCLRTRKSGSAMDVIDSLKEFYSDLSDDANILIARTAERRPRMVVGIQREDGTVRMESKWVPIRVMSREKALAA